MICIAPTIDVFSSIPRTSGTQMAATLVVDKLSDSEHGAVVLVMKVGEETDVAVSASPVVAQDRCQVIIAPKHAAILA